MLKTLGSYLHMVKSNLRTTRQGQGNDAVELSNVFMLSQPVCVICWVCLG